VIVNFCLAWLKTGRPVRQAFKNEAAFEWLMDYLKRIGKFSQCTVSGLPPSGKICRDGTRRWLCDRTGTETTSEDLARRLESTRDGGIRELQIFIGGADGWMRAEIQSLEPNFIWSFGPLTFAHELASVVAAEQVYRAWTILQGLPYHSKHVAKQ